jgi:hypothetical protein
MDRCGPILARRPVLGQRGRKGFSLLMIAPPAKPAPQSWPAPKPVLEVAPDLEKDLLLEFELAPAEGDSPRRGDIWMY